MRRIRYSFIGLLIIALALALGPVGTAFAGKNFVVDYWATDTIDAVPGNGTCADSGGNCSLRAAIMEVNARDKGDDVITLPAGTTILTRSGMDDDATNGDLDITTSMTIIGAGASTAIVGAGGGRGRGPPGADGATGPGGGGGGALRALRRPRLSARRGGRAGSSPRSPPPSSARR